MQVCGSIYAFERNFVMNKIRIFTGSRAEYGLLKPLLKAVDQDPEINLKILASGTHLSKEFGLTVAEIETRLLKSFLGVMEGLM